MPYFPPPKETKKESAKQRWNRQWDEKEKRKVGGSASKPAPKPVSAPRKTRHMGNGPPPRAHPHPMQGVKSNGGFSAPRGGGHGMIDHIRGSRGSNNVKALLHQTMEPVSAELARVPVPGFMPTVGTALARTVDTYSRDFSSYTLINPDYASTMKDRSGAIPVQNDLSIEPIVLLRDPVVSHIQRSIFTGLTSTNGPIYDAQFGFVGERILDTGATYVDALAVFVDNLPTELPISHMVHASGPQVYGSAVVAGQVGMRRVVWLDCNALETSPVGRTKVTVTMVCGRTPSEIGTHFKLVARHHHSETRNEAAANGTISLVSAHDPVSSTYQGVVYILSSGYYSFEVIPGGGGWDNYTDPAHLKTIDFEVTVRSETFFQHVMAEAMVGKEDIIRRCRVNGASVFLQNTSATQAKGGTVYAIQIAGDIPWYESIADVRDISNTNAVSRYVGAWEEGFYGYAKPQGTSPMEMLEVWDDLDNPANELHLPCFRPFNNIGTVVVLIQAPAALTGTFSPTQYTMHVVRAIEFTTNDQFFDVENPHIPLPDYDTYVSALSGMPQFFENPLHLAMIANLIARAAAVVVRYGPTAVSVAKAFIVGKELVKHKPGDRFVPLD